MVVNQVMKRLYVLDDMNFITVFQIDSNSRELNREFATKVYDE